MFKVQKKGPGILKVYLHNLDLSEVIDLNESLDLL